MGWRLLGISYRQYSDSRDEAGMAGRKHRQLYLCASLA